MPPGSTTTGRKLPHTPGSEIPGDTINRTCRQIFISACTSHRIRHSRPLRMNSPERRDFKSDLRPRRQRTTVDTIPMSQAIVRTLRIDGIIDDLPGGSECSLANASVATGSATSALSDPNGYTTGDIDSYAGDAFVPGSSERCNGTLTAPMTNMNA